MTGIPWRLVGALAGAALLVWAGIWITGRIRVSYQAEAERDAAEKALTDYQSAVIQREGAAAKEREQAAQRSERLAVKLEGVNAELEDLRANPVKSIEWRTRPAEGGICPDPRISAGWFRVRHEAFAAATRAVQPAD